MPAPYTASQIAKWLLSAIDRDSGDSITPLKLQKLIYYAQAWSLALPERAYPLFDEDMQAWAHGPVVESVFHEYKHAGWDALPAPDEVPEIAEKTHHEDPWLEARGDIPPEARSNAVISKERMMDYYRGLYEKAADDE